MNYGTKSTNSTDTIEEVDETDNGVDNPFRPGGGLSREADIIVQLIKAGKSISPTSPTREDIIALQAFKEAQEANGLLETSSSSTSPLSGRDQQLPSEVDGGVIKNQVNNGKFFGKNGNTKSTVNNLDNNRNVDGKKNGNNNKPSSPDSSKGSPVKKNSSPDHNIHDQQVIKKDAKRACCQIQWKMLQLF